MSNSKNSSLFQSLIKYDTPYLVSTTLKNKKAIDEMSTSEEKTIELLKQRMTKSQSDSSTNEEENFSVKDALNKILPPKKIPVKEQLWVQYVSCTPVTTTEVSVLETGLNKRLKIMNAKPTGICLIREGLYNECFDELIRQVTINCLERGILMMLVKKENLQTIKVYQDLYQSSIAYGIRMGLMAEEEKKKLSERIEKVEEENEELEKDIERIEKEIEDLIQNDKENTERLNEEHNTQIRLEEEKVMYLKNEIKNKWEIITKQNQTY